MQFFAESVEGHFGIESDHFDPNHFDEVNKFIEDNHRYFYPPENPDDYRFDVGNEHELVADVDAQTPIKLVKFLKRGKAPGPDIIHNEVLRLGTTTSLFHHLVGLFTSSIQLGYIPTAWKLATLRMLLKPDKLPSLTTSCRPISLISSVMKLFKRVIEQSLRSHLEHIRFIIKHQSGFRKATSTEDHLFRLSQFNRGEHVVAAFLDVEKAFEIKATTDCQGKSDFRDAQSDTATESSLHYFAHIVKVKFVLTHLLTVLIKHACQHDSFQGSRCVSSHAPTISLKLVLFTAIWALIFRH